MPFLDRDSFLALLAQLGSDNDEEALHAARELDRRVRAAGVQWDDLLMPEEGSEEFEDEDEEQEDEEEDEDFGEEVGAEEYEDVAMDGEDEQPLVEDTNQPIPAGDSAELIDRMLGDFDLSDETRQDLLDLKQDIAAGEFTEMDRRYLDALYARLSKQP
jgi:hypothetical protein